jgi:hypothetical protein
VHIEHEGPLSQTFDGAKAAVQGAHLHPLFLLRNPSPIRIPPEKYRDTAAALDGE